MDTKEALKWTNDQVFAKTRKHLNSLQMAIAEGVWQRKTYEQIGNEEHCSKHHVRKEAWKLWKLLSDVFEEDIRKTNFRSTLENGRYSHIANLHIGNGDINVCNENFLHQEISKKCSDTNFDNFQQQKHHDLTDVPKSDHIYNRTKEIKTLKQWILEDKIPIVTIVGLSGIGKTTLAVELVTQIKDNFDHIFWRNCTSSSTLESLKTNLIQFLAPQTETESLSLIDCFRSHRCLIILDDFHELFNPGEVAGHYRTNCQDYRKFIKQIATNSHNSCILILGWENPTEIVTLEGSKSYCRTLNVDGLGEFGQEIFTEMGLADEKRWTELIKFYSSNPLWLKIAATTIKQLFDGSVTKFLSFHSTFLGDIETILDDHYRRLSPAEKQVISWLASREIAVDIFAHQADISLSESELLKAVQSLLKRSLIEKIKEKDSSQFTLLPAIKKYVSDQL